MCTLYNRIVDSCSAKKVTPGKMCVDLGISKSTITWVKNGRTKSLSAPTAKKMAAYLDVPVAYLLMEEDLDENEEKPTDYGELSESEQALIDLFRQVPADQQELVLQMISVAVNKQQ